MAIFLNAGLSATIHLVNGKAIVMKDYLSEIDEKYPVRNSFDQKQSFRMYTMEEASKCGIKDAKCEDNENHLNMVFGDSEKAKVIFTAHYDTPRQQWFPNLMLVTNRILYWVYNLGIIAVFWIVSFFASEWVRDITRLDTRIFRDRMIWLLWYYILYYVLFFLAYRGPANKRNRNDNTSGTAAVMELMEQLKGRKDVAFILFDDEEKGKKGSKAFAKAHPEIKKNTLIINMDCVGNGETYVFIAPEAARNNPLYAKLNAVLEEKGLNVKMCTTQEASANSDHKNFEQGIGVCACKYNKFAGYYADRIHTSKDTVADPKTVSDLAEALSSFAESL